MMMWGAPMRFFGFIPLLFLVMFLARMLLHRKRHVPGTARMVPRWEREPQQSSEKLSSKPVPEALKQAGQQVLEGLDWEIRLLEREQAAIEDSKKRQEIEKELKHKRDEYQATVNRLEL